MTRPIPMIDDLALDYVTWARQRTLQRTLSMPVPGLDGDVQQGLGRSSHEIEIAGVLVGEDVADRLRELQENASSGEEVPFTADIATALEMENVIVVAAEFEEHAGRPGYYDYHMLLRESPPLPEPAELSPFGGLDGFDLGFDTDILGDITDMAGDLQGALEAVTDVLGDLEALAGLAGLSLGNPLTPVQEEAEGLGTSGGDAAGTAGNLTNLLEGG
ncbi:MAG: hypothetical protein L0Z73_19015 [Gammaproteobacteria bacterium]|nr:hypothetical protein [Gammaproteobacteria bacterium]